MKIALLYVKILRINNEGKTFSCSFFLSILKPFNGHLLNTSYMHIVLGITEKWWLNNQVGSRGSLILCVKLIHCPYRTCNIVN